MQFLKYTHFLPYKNCAQIPMYTALEAIYPNVKSPPKRTLLLTSQGTILYLCGRKQGDPIPTDPIPYLPQGEGVNSAAELDTPNPTKPAQQSKGNRTGVNQKQQNK